MRKEFIPRISQRLFLIAAKIFKIRRYESSPELILMDHPRPCYGFHALALPRHAEANFLSISPVRLAAFAAALERSQLQLFAASGTAALALIVNGGLRQTFPLFHAHVIAADGLGSWDEHERFTAIDAALASARERLAMRRVKGYSVQLRLTRGTGDILARIRYD